MTKAGNSQIMRTIPLLITIFSLSLPFHPSQQLCYGEWTYAQYSGGTGESNAPYQIATAEDLIALGESPEDYDKHFILTADIDLDPNLPGRRVFDKAVIAPDMDPNDKDSEFQGTPFTGVIDGQGHTISHLTLVGDSYLGLFGQLFLANISNLGLEAVEVSGTGDCVGGLVGLSHATVTQCFSTGVIKGIGSAVGGLVGCNAMRGRVTQCYACCVVSGSNDGAGGLVGANADGSTITNSCSSGSVIGGSSVGGLVGWNTGRIVASYANGSVSADSSVGGLVGHNARSSSHWGHLTYCYSSGTVNGISGVGGLIGDNTGGSITSSFWDIQTSGQTTSAGGMGLTTTEMMDPQMLGLNGFASYPNWVLDAGRDYPRLAWEGTVGGIIPEPNMDWLAGQGTPDSPYRIDTADQLILLSKASILWDRHFVLGADIDLDPALPGRCIFAQAVVQEFTGVFDGAGHVISHLTIQGVEKLGLFGSLTRESEVRNLGVVNANITGSGGYVSGLVGYNAGSVRNSYSSGSVCGTGSVGGLVGSNDGNIVASYSIGSVSGDWYVGGLVGYNWTGSIAASYSSGRVSGTGHSVGGLVGHKYASVSSSFWDIETSAQTTSGGGAGKTTAEMKMASTFLEAGWDFVDETVNGPNDIWKMWDEYDYPRLVWETGPNTPLVFVDINDPGFYGQMSKYEVTNAQYCDFLNAALASDDITVDGNDVYGATGSNGGEDYAGQRYYRCDGSGYTGYGATNGGAARIHYSAGAFSVDDGFGNHPVTYVSWYGAMAFANYYGYYLPTEDQWQAVADYDGTYIYGCGETIDPGIANYRYSEHPDGTTSVGGFGVYGYGMSDMAGNVWEWTSSSLDSSCIFRGGSLGSIDSDCDVSIRGDGIPYAAYYDIGFRVCR